MSSLFNHLVLWQRIIAKHPSLLTGVHSEMPRLIWLTSSQDMLPLVGRKSKIGTNTFNPNLLCTKCCCLSLHTTLVFHVPNVFHKRVCSSQQHCESQITAPGPYKNPPVWIVFALLYWDSFSPNQPCDLCSPSRRCNAVSIKPHRGKNVMSNFFLLMAGHLFRDISRQVFLRCKWNVVYYLHTSV